MKKNKLLLAVVGVLALAVILMAVYLLTRPKTAEGGKTVTVTVVHADETEKTFTYETDAEYLGEVLEAEGLVEGTMGDYGLYITKVDGEEAIYEEDGSYWAFFRKGAMSARTK